MYMDMFMDISLCSTRDMLLDSLDLAIDASPPRTQTLHCLKMGGFATTLLVSMLVPLLMLLVVYVACLASVLAQYETAAAAGRAQQKKWRSVQRDALLKATPWMLLPYFYHWPLATDVTTDYGLLATGY